MIKIVTVVGARPQFIKAATISRGIQSQFFDRVQELLVHTGQHYDENMSQVFFDELKVPVPKYNLKISGGSHGAMTGRMLAALEEVLLHERPDWLLIYGDTNSTLAGALAAAKLHIRIAHIEAGIRSFNMRMPEEINRVIADKLSTLLLCPTEQATNNLADEGIRDGVYHVGDVMYDIALHSADASNRSDILDRLNALPKKYVLATCHRPENTDDPSKLANILRGLRTISNSRRVIFSLHPRSRGKIQEFGLEEILRGISVIAPIPYLDMAALQRHAEVIITDSGGMQKEAFFYRVPCVTIRPDTEWPETIKSGWNTLVDNNTAQMISEVENCSGRLRDDIPSSSIFGAGDAALRSIDRIIRET